MDMNVTNFRLIMTVLVADHLKKIQSGDVHWNVNNQFDDSVCESALEVLETDDEAVECAYQNFCKANIEYLKPMTIAHYLSNFEVPELESAWVD